MKVAILTEGGGRIGYGHISRCTSVYHALVSYGVTADFIVHSTDCMSTLPGQCLYRIADWINDPQCLKQAVQNCDVVFVDSYIADLKVYNEILSYAGKAVYFDDYRRIEYPEGTVVNGAISAEKLNYPKANALSYLLGVKYFPLKKDFWSVASKRIRREVETILVTCGGSDVCNLTPKIQKLLNHSYPNIAKKIVVTGCFGNIAQIKSLQDDNTELLFDLDGSEFKDLMLECDVAISAGGQTLYELARVGIATIAVCVQENQSLNISGWTESGAMEYSGWYNDEDFELKLTVALDNMMAYERRVVCSESSRAIVDGKGALRIVKETLANHFQNEIVLRPAANEDAGLVFDLSNDAVVRRNSFDSKPILWDSHVLWFNNKLADKNCCFFIVEYGDEIAGQVRFDIEQETTQATISICLSANVRGLGLSAIIIDKAIEKLHRTLPLVSCVFAYIKCDNAASIKAFVKSGFEFVENTVIAGSDSVVYKKSW